MHKSLLCTTLLLAAAFEVKAVVVTGVTVSGGNTFFGNLNNIVDGSGLSSYSTGATHAAGTAQNAWASATILNQIVFDLHGAYNLTGMAVWNFNEFNGFGVNTLNVLASLDGINYNPIPGAPMQFAQGANSAPEQAQLFSFSATAAYVRFDTLTTFQNAAGLSEVMFTASSVPEPASLAMFGIGVAGLAGWRRLRLGTFAGR
jgi:hypothetical protein